MVLRRIVLLAAVFLGTTAARAQLTWTGATNGNFDLAGNWSGSFVNDGTASVTFTGAPANSPVLNVPVSLASLTYAAGTASFTIASSGGNALTLGSALNQNSGNLQTIAAPLVLGSGFSFNGAGAPTALALIGGVTASNGFTVTNGLAVQISHSAWTVGGTVAL